MTAAYIVMNFVSEYGNSLHIYPENGSVISCRTDKFLCSKEAFEASLGPLSFGEEGATIKSICIRKKNYEQIEESEAFRK